MRGAGIPPLIFQDSVLKWPDMRIYSPLFILGCIASVTPVCAENVSRIDTDEPIVCLTFDDGPVREHALHLIQILGQHDAVATFFVIGERVEAEADALKQLQEAGHEIGNHTFTHPNLAKLDSRHQLHAEILRCQEAVIAATGSAPQVFRAPYLSQDERVESLLASLGMPSIFASASTEDWNQDTTAESILERAIKGLEPGAILLMHEFRKETIDVLPELLAEMRARGLRAVTVSEALRLQRIPAAEQ